MGVIITAALPVPLGVSSEFILIKRLEQGLTEHAVGAVWASVILVIV